LVFEVKISRQVERYLEDLARVSRKEAEHCAKALKALAENPLTPRPGADIKKLHGVKGLDYRLRVGRHRFYYTVEDQIVYVKVAFFK
jgi:mRNA-degrading endonuclease RelE of RelBE toxin-antitoxin system